MSRYRVLLAVLIVGVALAPNARADFTPLVLVSGTTTEEADYASQPAISSDGTYVVFTGSLAGIPGIYRKNLQTGAVDMVAAGDAGGPSVSADGRYISFTTTATDPAAGSGSQCSSVYVRDMSIPADQSDAYTLASALSGTTAGLSYAGSTTAGCPGGGSSAADRVALSGDGSQVAFTVVGSSNLTTGPTGNPTTPPAQVVVRNLLTDTTTLVSQTQSSIGLTPQPVPGGAAMTDNSTGTEPNPGTQNAAPGDSSASISADGTTVAWLGINIPAQAPASAADQPYLHANEYDEPLWRRIADGPGAPIRRVTGGDDPVGPCPGGCSGPLDTRWDGEANESLGQNPGPEQGSFIAYNGFTSATTTARSTLDDATPQLSANGQTVAILSTQPATGQDPICGQVCTNSVSANAYIVDMAPGLSRSQALTRITAWASNDFTDFSLAGPIDNIAISPEGDRVAFVTRRTTFPYSPPALITPQLTQVANDQLYVADLTDGTLQLVTTGYDGQAANATVDSPTFSANNGPMAFSSAATNLVYGAYSDVTGGRQVFTTTQVKPPATPGVSTISPPPANPRITPEWVIGVSAHHKADGSVVLYVSVPGPGAVSAAARASVPVGSRRSRARRHGRQRFVPAVGVRTAARAAARSRAVGSLRLTLKPSTRYRSLIVQIHGLYATVELTFSSPGHPRLTDKLPVDFVQSKRKSRKR